MNNINGHKYLIISTVFVLCTLFSCINKNTSHTDSKIIKKNYHNNGELSEIKEYNNEGKLDGRIQKYNNNGEIELEYYCKNDILNGYYREYKNGCLEKETIYFKGQQQIFKKYFYNESGELKKVKAYELYKNKYYPFGDIIYSNKQIINDTLSSYFYIINDIDTINSGEKYSFLIKVYPLYENVALIMGKFDEKFDLSTVNVMDTLFADKNNIIHLSFSSTINGYNDLMGLIYESDSLFNQTDNERIMKLYKQIFVCEK